METLPQKEHDHDKFITRRFVAGDESVLAAMLDEFGPRTRKVLAARFRGMLDYSDVDFAFSEAVASAWANREKFDPDRAALRGWVFILTRNNAIDEIRARGLSHRTDSESSNSRSNSTPTGVEALFERVSDPAWREVALRDLAEAASLWSETERDVMQFYLNHSEGKWADELSKAMKIPAGHIRVARFRAVDKVRKHLLAKGYALRGEKGNDHGQQKRH